MSLGLVASLAILAAANGPALNCKDPQSNLEMKFCAEREWKRADAELNAIFAKALADANQHNAMRRQPGYDKMPDSVAMLKEAQRAWVTFRDANCAYHYQVYYGGSHAGLAYLLCKADMTKTRVKELRALMNGGEDPQEQ
jgi:uncharacterized protein YecT (DUF1311 family)